MLIEVLSPAPVLNISDFSFAFGGKSGNEIPLNEKGHPYCFEFVALKGMIFEVEESIHQEIAEIYRIVCPFYPKQHLFLDSRFAKPAIPNVIQNLVLDGIESSRGSAIPNGGRIDNTAPFGIAEPRGFEPAQNQILSHVRYIAFAPKRPLPPADIILKRMIEMTGTPYVWGGNWKAGIPELLIYYSPKTPIDDQTSILWTLNGVDCSGLLFETTEGATPRNTAQLVHFGVAVPLNSPLKPLDMIVYPGHVVFVQDEKTTIESKFPFGVIQRDLSNRIWEFDAVRKRVENWSPGLDPLKFYTIRRIT